MDRSAGSIWNEGASGSIYIEFGKSPAEATVMRATILKVFGPKATTAALIKGNVMFYTNHGLEVTGQESSTVESCLH